METLVQERTRLEYHPSFDRGMPAIIAEPVDVGYCEVCAWLASEIRKADARDDWSRVADHARTALRHWYAIHEPDAVTTLQTRHNGGAR